MHPTTHHFATVNGHTMFYREAGDPALPAINPADLDFVSSAPPHGRPSLVRTIRSGRY
jgi:hypothetical protein